MVYKVLHEKRAGYLYVNFKGQESYEDAIGFWIELLREGKYQKESKYLVVGEPKKSLSHIEVKVLCQEIAKMAKGKVIAYVDPSEEAYRENAFGDLVTSNRGANACAFKDESKAEEWLLGFK